MECNSLPFQNSLSEMLGIHHTRIIRGALLKQCLNVSQETYKTLENLVSGNRKRPKRDKQEEI